MHWKDDIVEEVRAARQAYAARFGYDLEAIYADLKPKEQSGMRLIADLQPLEPRPSAPSPKPSCDSTKPHFSIVWNRIKAHSGEVFHQIRGGEFTYSVQSGCVHPDRIDQQIPRAHFEKALKLVPLENTVPLQRLRGPSYLYAILMDARVRQQDW